MIEEYKFIEQRENPMPRGNAIMFSRSFMTPFGKCSGVIIIDDPKMIVNMRGSKNLDKIPNKALQKLFDDAITEAIEDIKNNK